jgi:hypothetical protein
MNMEDVTPTLDQLRQYAVAVGLIPPDGAPTIQMLDVLQRQVMAAWALLPVGDAGLAKQRELEAALETLRYAARGVSERTEIPSKQAAALLAELDRNVTSVEFPALVPVPPETLAALLRETHSRIDGAAKPMFFQPSMVVGCVTLAALIAELSALRAALELEKKS